MDVAADLLQVLPNHVAAAGAAAAEPATDGALDPAAECLQAVAEETLAIETAGATAGPGSSATNFNTSNADGHVTLSINIGMCQCKI